MRDFESDLRRDVPRGVNGASGQLVEACWAGPEELQGPAWDYRNAAGDVAGMIVGHRYGRFYGLCDDRHMLTIAGSRGGKGVSLIVPFLLSYSGSVLAIDPKGELARITARARREMGQKVIEINPFGGSPDRINPLMAIDLSSDTALDDIGVVADGLVTRNGKDPHWTDSAYILLKGLIGLVLTFEHAEDRTLGGMRRLLMLSHPAVIAVAAHEKCDREAALFKLMEGCGEPLDGFVAGVGAAYAAMSDRERSSILSTARTQTEFLDSKRVAQCLSGTDAFRLEDLKKERMTLYLGLPATRMATHMRLMRVIINLAIVAFEQEKTRPANPVVMVLDEFASLGHMRSLEVAAGQMAGFGLKLWVVLQDIGQIKGIYREGWETFIGNAGVITAHAISDQTTLEYISQKLGQTGVRIHQPSGAPPGARLHGASSTRDELRVQRLLAAHEVEALTARERERVIVMVAGRRPAIFQRMIYWRDEAFEGLFDP